MKAPASTHPALSAGFLARLNDGELPDRERAEFELHRSECGECRDAAAEYETVLELYRAVRAKGEDPALVSRLRRRLDARLSEPARAQFLPVRLDVAWASILVVALCAGLLLRGVILERSRRDRESRVLIADQIRPLPPPAASPAAPVIASPQARPAPSAGEPASEPGAVAENQPSAARARDAGETRDAFAMSAPATLASRIAIEDLPDREIADMEPPVRVFSPIPQESDWAAWTRASGSAAALFRIDVDADGRVTGAELEAPKGHRAEDDVLLDVIRGWRFTPARRGGQSIPAAVSVRLRGTAARPY